MKKIVVVSVMVFVVISFPTIVGVAGDRNDAETGKRSHLRLVLSGNYLAPGDPNFKEFYSSGVIFPELRMGYHMTDNIYVWAGYGFFTVTGESAELSLELKSRQGFFSGGIGYAFGNSSRWSFIGELGLFSCSYKEELGDGINIFKGSAIGFSIKNGLVYRLSQLFFLEFTLGYASASETIGDETDTQFKLGGFRTGLGIGVRW